MISYIGILDLCMELNVKFYFCDIAMKFLNIEESEFIEGLNIKALPLYHIINVHKDNKTFYITLFGGLCPSINVFIFTQLFLPFQSFLQQLQTLNEELVLY